MKTEEYIVLSSDKQSTYTVRQEGNRWFCSCKSFQYNCHTPEGLKNSKRRFCKHIESVKNAIC